MVLSLSLGFFSVSGFGEYAFVGLANYRQNDRRSPVLALVQVTVLYVVALVPLLYATGLGLALLVQANSRFNTVARSLLFMPQTVSLVVVGPRVAGAAGRQDRGLQPDRRLLSAWARSPGSATRASPSFSVIVISVWFLMGFYMLIFLGGLQDIPRGIFRGGANRRRRASAVLFRDTLPSCSRPASSCSSSRP